MHAGAETLEALRALDQRWVCDPSSLVTALRSAERCGIDPAGRCFASAHAVGGAIASRGPSGWRARHHSSSGRRSCCVSHRARWWCWRFRWRGCWRWRAADSVAVTASWLSDASVRCGRRLSRVRFERQQVLGAVDVELGAGHRQAHQPVDVTLQQQLRAAIAAQLVELAETPARKNRRHTDTAARTARRRSTPDCAATRPRAGGGLRW